MVLGAQIVHDLLVGQVNGLSETVFGLLEGERVDLLETVDAGCVDLLGCRLNSALRSQSFLIRTDFEQDFD